MDNCKLILGAGLGDDMVDTNQCGDVIGRSLHVTSRHQGFDTHRMELGDGLAGIAAGFIGDAKDRGQLPVYGHEYRGFALGGEFGGDFLRRTYRDGLFFQPLPIADEQRVFANQCTYTSSGFILEGTGFFQA